jgi:hypothetical protein
MNIFCGQKSTFLEVVLTSYNIYYDNQLLISIFGALFKLCELSEFIIPNFRHKNWGPIFDGFKIPLKIA